MRSRLSSPSPWRVAWLAAIVAWATMSGLAAEVWSSPPPEGQGPLPAEVDRAQRRLMRYLLAQQDADEGHWEQRYERGRDHGGETALVALALLEAGVPAQHPAMAQALAWLKRQPRRGTYAVAMRCQLWSRLSEGFAEARQADAQWLLAAHDGHSRFGYTPRESPIRYDHSVTHLAAQGLAVVAQRDPALVPDRFWSNLRQHLLEAQQVGGGWSYRPDKPPSGSITAAGVGMLSAARLNLEAEAMRADAATAEAIRDGVGWLDRFFVPSRNPGSGAFLFYYLQSVHQAAQAEGLHRLNGLPWHDAAVRTILRYQGPDGSVQGDRVSSAMALRVLAGWRPPAWIGKLVLADQAWHQRPGDVRGLCDRLSGMSERRLAWRRVRVDGLAADVALPPVLYVASDASPRLSSGQRAGLRGYLDRGGLLVGNPDTGSGAFQEGMEQLGRALYPEARWGPLPADHPLWRAWQAVSPNRRASVNGLEHAGRVLMLRFERDVGFGWQARAEPKDAAHWVVGANLWSWTSERGRYAWQVPASPKAAGDLASPRHELGVAACRFGPQTPPEPGLWPRLAAVLRTRGGPGLNVSLSQPKDLNPQQTPLAHVAADAVGKLDAGALIDLIVYASEGGTVLVETVGGRGGFAAEVQARLAKRLGQPGVPLPLSHPIIDGRDLPGGVDARRVRWRTET